MFCSANDVLVSLTEKTKVFAQKCTQQIQRTTTNNHHQHLQKQQKHQHRHHSFENNETTSSTDAAAIEHIKSISKSHADVYQCDGDKSSHTIFESISPRKSNANAYLRGKNLAIFHTLTGSLRIRRRKSLSDTENASNSCGRKRNKSNALNVGYATTRWYVKVSI